MMKLAAFSGLVFLVCSGAVASAQGLSQDQLTQLVGPIALYPDPLVAEILPAATFPAQITLAERYVSGGGDPNQIPEQGWDPSVQALANYANVLKWMDDNLPWTTQVGEAFQNQQADVMAAIQQLRGQAQNLGNLPTTPQESVVDDDGDIEIDPTDANQMYVPSYDPNSIYSQPGIYCTFPYALPIGAWLVYDWNWHNHGLIFWGPGHERPGDWWHRPPAYRHTFIAGHPEPVWHGGGVGAARGGWERGYESHPAEHVFAHPEAPREVPHNNVDVSVIHSNPTTWRNVPAFHPSPAPAPSRGVFGGQSGHEAVESSARGAASRAEIHSAPAPEPHGGGGGESHGFSGGGGGSHGGGGGHH